MNTNPVHQRIALLEDALLKIANGAQDPAALALWALKEGTKIEIPDLPDDQEDDDGEDDDEM